VDTYQPLALCSTQDPCSGSIAVYPLVAGNSSSTTCSTSVCLGAPVTNTAVGGQYWPLTLASAPKDVIVPTAVDVLASGSYIYVTAYDSSVTPSVGYVFGFSVSSSGALTPLNGGVPFPAGVQPSSIASDPTSTYVYVTDFGRGNVQGYTVGASGSLTALSGSPFPAGNQPTAIVVDPSYPYAYVANSLDSTVEAYSISSGKLSFLGNSSTPATYATGLQPVAMGIDPSTNHFIYTANYLGNTVSGFVMSTTDGTLLESQFTPYAASSEPVAVVAIPHNGTGAGVQK